MRAVVFVNGDLLEPQLAANLLTPQDFIIAADGGLNHLRVLGHAPRLLIGDLDSVNPGDEEWVRQEGGEVLRFPEDKNFTDLELALREARQRGFNQIMIVAALGGRMDQTLANIGLLFHPEYESLEFWLDDGRTRVERVRGRLSIEGAAGDIISLIPWGADAFGIVTQGLKYPLNGENLLLGQTRGISNRLLAETADVRLQSGALLCVHLRR